MKNYPAQNLNTTKAGERRFKGIKKTYPENINTMFCLTAQAIW